MTIANLSATRDVAQMIAHVTGHSEYSEEFLAGDRATRTLLIGYAGRRICERLGWDKAVAFAENAEKIADLEIPALDN